MDLLQKLNKFKSLPKSKLTALAIGIVAIIIVFSLVINIFSLSLNEVKGFNGFPLGKISEIVERELLSDKRAPKGMSLVAEDDGAALFFDTVSAKIAVLDKKTDNIFYSNPINSDTDKIATGANKAKLESQLIVNYYDESGKSGSFNTYEGCIKQENLNYDLIKDGIRIEFLMGDNTVSREMLPVVVLKDKFENKILNKLDEEQKEELLEYYELTSVEESGKSASKKYKELYTKIEISDNYYFLDLYFFML